MNGDRRKDISKAMDTLGEIRPLVESLISQLNSIAEEERESADTIEENFPGTERAERTEESASNLEEAASDADSLNDLLDAIETAAEAAAE